MSEDQSVQSELAAQFPFLTDQVRNPRPRRLFAKVSADQIGAVFDHLFRKMDFKLLPGITGLDLGESLGVIYHLARASGIVLSVETSVPKADPVLQTVSTYFPAADVYERELVDLLGVQVQGLGKGSRYPLPDDWPVGQYPLRKDWKSDSLHPAAAGLPKDSEDSHA